MRTCIFCNNKASTGEDAWPKWLMKRFPASNTSYMDAERGGKKLRIWSMSKPKLVVNWLCAKCNNGWMSLIESKTKPVLVSILDDKLSAIDSSSQSTLACWAVKTSMVLECLYPNRTWFYTNDERQLMRTTQTLPPRTSVWIAKCVEPKNIYSAAKDLRTSLDDNGVHAYATTMAFGSIAFQVVSIKTPETIPESVSITYDVTEGPWEKTLLQVWPVIHESLEWPAGYGLNSELGLDALTERLSPKRR
jgi:hypothetical protein